jgi:signal transduction histidine kinase
MRTILDVTLLLSVGVHIGLLAFLQFSRIPVRWPPLGLQIAVLAALLANLVNLLPVPAALPIEPGLLAITLMAALVIAFGTVIMQEVYPRGQRFWLLIGSLWLLALLGAGLLNPTVAIGQEGWLLAVFARPNSPEIIALGGLALAIIALIGLAFYGFYHAALPEAANRALFWVLNSAALALGILLSISGTLVFQATGTLVVLAALIGAVYAHMSHQVMDIRRGVVAAARTVVLIALTSGLILLALRISETLTAATPDEQALTLLALALLTGTALVLSWQIIILIFNRLWRPQASPTQAARQYSQQISRAVELADLIRTATETINQALAVQRSGMILVNDTDQDENRVELIVMQQAASSADLRGAVLRNGPLYQQLAIRRLPVTLFDLEFGPPYRALDAGERQFFRSLGMNAFAPIVVENTLIGILTAGPKLNDTPFSATDLELLATMADQTGVALRNARAMADLRHLNATMRALNEELEEANQQYEKLDSVKTDFITIASHELRTPLAQIRGYTDILDALNEQGMLDQDQISGLVQNLRKAAERTEDLLTAMLDVSQLDVNAMDLRFAQAAPESILRMAIEPMTEHIRQRKLSLSARGLRGLPTIHCDMQRLVQAFRNLITNAIKYTPDGGRIDITASLQPGRDGRGDHILIAIADTGIGIDKADLELIFEKFYRVSDPSLHSTGAFKFMGAGPGLGLTIARGVIESHGGRVWAESSGHNMETCPGSVFYVLLPVNPPEETRRVAIDDSAATRPSR